MTTAFDIVRFDEHDESHVRFVRDAIRKRANDWPYQPSDRFALLDAGARAYRDNPDGCLLAIDPTDPTLFYGYVLTLDGAVTMAYTKRNLRGPGEFGAPVGTARDPGCPPVCKTLLHEAGIELERGDDGVRGIPVAIWSPAASKIAARGYSIYPQIPTKGTRE